MLGFFSQGAPFSHSSTMESVETRCRFSPFTFSPRDCLGKNFAQMEMRTIMANVFRKFKFGLSDSYAKHNPATDGPIENFQGTMGTVRVFRLKSPPEDAIGSHACSLEALPWV
jgi:hypothetical protein